tara:strand:+ start:101 stop:220 length:120 start_codon:yes stop_codon:yes gene_type:complete
VDRTAQRRNKRIRIIEKEIGTDISVGLNHKSYTSTTPRP